MIDQEMLEAMKVLLQPINDRLDRIEAKQDKMEAKQDKMEAELFRIGALQDNYVIPGIKLLAEGHQDILAQMDRHIEERLEPVECRVEALEATTKLIVRDLRELKRAQ